jgi:predicted metal-dependent hydrolase
MSGNCPAEACTLIETNATRDQHWLCYDNQRISFRIQFRERKRLAISVYPDQRLEIIAPLESDLDEVLRRVEKRKSWIFKQIRLFSRFSPKKPSPVYETGESIRYLGRQYRLKVQEGNPESVKLIGPFLHVWTLDKTNRDEKARLVEAWYRHHAKRIFLSRVAMWLKKSQSLRTDIAPEVSIRIMQSRWGSCTKAGNISLNPELVKTPIQCIDYVIVHELCHRIVHNHSPEFYRLLTRCIPDWEARKLRLEESLD